MHTKCVSGKIWLAVFSLALYIHAQASLAFYVKMENHSGKVLSMNCVTRKDRGAIATATTNDNDKIKIQCNGSDIIPHWDYAGESHHHDMYIRNLYDQESYNPDDEDITAVDFYFKNRKDDSRYCSITINYWNFHNDDCFQVFNDKDHPCTTDYVHSRCFDGIFHSSSATVHIVGHD